MNDEQLRRARTGRRAQFAELGEAGEMIIATIAQLERQIQRIDERLTTLEALANAGGTDELAARRRLGPVID